nr:hypothetical protein [Candidatus Njordarchaeum guaymaensis]
MLSEYISKHFKINRELKRRFEALCKAIDIPEYQVLNRLIDTWIKENQSQLRLDSFVPEAATVTIHAQTVNIEQRFEVQMIKLEMEKALDLVARVPDNQEFKEQLLKAAIKAGRLYRQTRDPELESLIRKVEETL